MNLLSALSGNSTIWFFLVPTGPQLAQKTSELFSQPNPCQSIENHAFYFSNLFKLCLEILQSKVFLCRLGHISLLKKLLNFFFYPYFSGWATQQASVYHGQTHDLPRQSIGKGFHQEKEQMVSPLNNFGNAPHFFPFWHEIPNSYSIKFSVT